MWCIFITFRATFIISFIVHLDMNPTNRYLRDEDYALVSFQFIKKECDRVYHEVFGAFPSSYGTKRKNQSLIHWSRDWEYPWAIISSEVKKGEKVLDCGCGGSPLLPVLALHGCDCYGIDPNVFMNRSFLLHYTNSLNSIVKECREIFYGKKPFVAGIKTVLSRMYHSVRRPSNLWGLARDPNKLLKVNIKYSQHSLEKIPFENDFFDKVYCISVIEHLAERTALQGVKEMARVLKKGGLLVITMDDNGPHVNPAFVSNFQKIIAASGLKLHGQSCFSKPVPEDVPGTYNVVGFVLEK